MGVLEFSDKFWFLRTKNYQISSVDDVFVHSSFVNRFHLKVGDFVVCKAKRRKENECPGVTFIVSVNGKRPESFGGRRPFESLVPCYPDKRYTLEGEDFTARIIDLFSPIGCGQRALIVSPPKAGKTTMLKSIACAITKHNPTAHVMVLLVDERPEEVTDIRRTVSGAEVIYSTFDKGEMHHIHSAMLALERAKRLVEMGEDVVLLMDSITRLVRAFNATVNSGRILSGGLDPQALVEPRKFFGSARNIEGGGSLTIIATALVDTGSRLDDIIYEEFKSAGNMEIILSRDLAERRIFPAIDIKASGARKEELLLSPEELSTSHKLRGLLSNGVNTENLFAMIEKTQTNADLCQKADEWLKVYRNK
jgi:transcription termination factor Rho